MVKSNSFSIVLSLKIPGFFPYLPGTNVLVGNGFNIFILLGRFIYVSFGVPSRSHSVAYSQKKNNILGILKP